MLTPAKKPPGGELRPYQVESNSAMNSVRAVVEREIGNLKSWWVLQTDYRRPLGTFVDTISAVLGLQFLRLSEAL